MSYLRVRAAQCLFVAILTFLSQSAYTEPPISMVYELYSWKVSDGRWSFCVLPNTNSEKSVQQVFSDKTRLQGVEALESELGKLPSGTTIVWVGRLPTERRFPKTPGSEALGFPSPDMIKEIRSYADVHGLKLVGAD